MQRTVRKTTLVFVAATGVFILLLAQPDRLANEREFDQSTAGSDPRAIGGFQRRTGRVRGGGDIEEGLGPVFNGKSCAECHAVPSTGGSEPNVGVARETRISRIFNGRFDPLDGSVSVDRGGQLLQQRAIDVQGCTLKGEVVPPEATIVSMPQQPRRCLARG